MVRFRSPKSKRTRALTASDIYAKLAHDPEAVELVARLIEKLASRSRPKQNLSTVD